MWMTSSCFAVVVSKFVTWYVFSCRFLSPCDFPHLLIRVKNTVKICTLDAAATIADKIVLDNRAAFLRLHTPTVHQRGVLLIPGTAYWLAALSCGPFTFWT